MALVSKDSDRPADWVLSLGLWILMGLTSKPRWNSSEIWDQNLTELWPIAFFLDTWSWTCQNAHTHTIKQCHTRGMLMFVCRSPECRHFSCWHPRLAVQKFCDPTFCLVLAQRFKAAMSERSLNSFYAVWRGWTCIMSICFNHMFSFSAPTNVEYTWRCLTLSKPVWWDFSKGQVRRMFSCKA